MGTEATKKNLDIHSQSNELQQEVQIGLSSWFMNPEKNESLEKICKAGHVHFWAEKIHATLQQNEWENGDLPYNWTSLGRSIGRNGAGFTVYAGYQKHLIKTFNKG